MIEIERRYKIYDPQATIDALDDCGLKLQGEQHIIDKWFIPKSINTQTEHNEWFDKNHGIAYRIRKK